MWKQRVSTIMCIALLILQLNSLVNATANLDENSGGAGMNTLTGSGILMDGSASGGDISASLGQNSSLEELLPDEEGTAYESFSDANLGDDEASGSKEPNEDETVSGGDVEDETVSGGDIEDDTVSGGDIEDGTVSGGDIEDGTVSGGDVEDETVSGGDIEASDDTVNDPDISDDANKPDDLNKNESLQGDSTDNNFTENKNAVISENDATEPNGDNVPEELEPIDGDLLTKVYDGVDTVSENRIVDSFDLEPGKISICVPRNLNFVMDPYNLAGRGDVWSMAYSFRNSGETAVVLKLSDIKCHLKNGSAGVDLGINPSEIHNSSEKLISLKLILNGNDVIDIMNEASGYEVLLEPGQGLSFAISGAMSLNPIGKWQSGDVSISMVYTATGVASTRPIFESDKEESDMKNADTENFDEESLYEDISDNKDLIEENSLEDKDDVEASDRSLTENKNFDIIIPDNEEIIKIDDEKVPESSFDELIHGENQGQELYMDIEE